MITSPEEFGWSKSRDMVTLECLRCKQTFKKQKNFVQRALKGSGGHTGNFCSGKCHSLNRVNKILLFCAYCGKEVIRTSSDLKYIKNVFCNHSCSATYHNARKKHGTRRSKLEVWLEEKLKALYPLESIRFNQKDSINSELDIHFVDLSIAFELNGIFHYEPIYGGEKLKSIKNNDARKFQACLEKKIELCIIDTSHIKHFKDWRGEETLKIITCIVDAKRAGRGN